MFIAHSLASFTLTWHPRAEVGTRSYETEGKLDVKAILIEANTFVEQAGVPQDLRPTAFAKAVDLVVAREGVLSSPADHPSTPHLAKTRDESGSAVSRIAAKLKVDVDVARDVYHEQDGEIHVTVPPAKLDPGKKGATKQLALLLAAGRQAAGLEDFTSVDKVREVAVEYNKYDGPNFARAIGDLSDYLNFLGGSKNRSIKISRPGWEEASTLVNRLGGGAS